MALYKLIGENEALNPIMNYNGNSNWLLNQRNSLYGPTDQQTQVYNALGRNDGTQQGDENFFQKRAKSIENAFGTTGASIADAFKSGGALGIWKGTENIATADLLNDTKAKMNEVYKKFGFEGRDDYDRQLDAAEAAGDNNEVQRLLNLPGLQAALQIQANENANAANKKAADYEDYRKNNYAAQKVNQDRGKFLGSAINTLSTAYDVASMATGIPNGPITNAVQGGVEGIADELEQNGLENFDWGRAGQNAAIGAATGAATGAFNNALGGRNILGKGLTNKLSKTGLGRATLGIANGAVRGAASGAVGGATGAGLSSAINGVDIGTGLQNTLQGAARGAKSGAMTGAAMAGINMGTNAVLNKYAPQAAQKLQDTAQEYQRWKDSGKDFNERLTNTLTSGRSAVGEWLQGNRQSKVLGAAGNIGNRISPIGSPKYDKAMDLAKRALAEFEQADPYEFEESMTNMAEAEGLDWNTTKGKKAFTDMWLKGTTRDILTGGDDREMWAGSLEDYVDAPQLENGVNPLNGGTVRNAELEQLINEIRSFDKSDTPTTAKGWLKKAGQRIVEDVNNKGVGLSIKDVSETDRPDGNWRSGKVGDYEYEAKYYNTDPDEIDQRGGYNIKGSPLSKLFIKDKNGEYVANYDRGWGDGKPTDPRVLQAVDDVNNYYRNEWESIQRSGLPNDVDAEDIRALVQVDSSNKLSDAIAEATKGRDVSLQDVADKYWDEVRYRYESKVANDAQQTITPTTASGWLKKAGKRIAEDANNSNLGMRVKNVDENSDVINMADGQTSITPENPETEVYRALNGQPSNPGWDIIAQEAGFKNYDDAVQRFVEANPNAEVNSNNILNWLDNGSTTAETIDTTTQPDIVPSKASKETKLRYARGNELVRQYGTVDQPMARATKAVETFQEIADMGFTKPEDVERISNAVTGSNGLVSKLNSSVVASAKPVNTFEGNASGQTIDEFIDQRIQKRYLSGTNAGKAVKQGLNAYLSALPSRAEGSVTFEDTAADTFKVVQQLEADAAELEGRGGRTYHRASTEDLHQAAVIKDVANLLKERIYDGADVKTAITPEVVRSLKSLDPENTAWAKTVDNFASTAKSPQDLRRFQKPFVRASRYIDNQYIQAATVGGRMAANAGELPQILPTTKAGLIKQAANTLWNSNPAHRAKAKLYGKLADREAAKTASTTIPAQTAETTIPAQTAETTSPIQYNPATQVYNAIGRNEGATARDRVADYLAETAQEAEVVPNTATAATTTTTPTANVANTTTGNNASTSVYNALTGTSTPTTNGMTLEEERQVYFFRPTGDEWSDMLSRAMRRAKNAEDYDALGQLYEMYQNSLSNIQKNSEKDYSNPLNWSSTDRKEYLKAQNGLSQIDAIENSYNSAVGDGSNAVQGTLRQWANNISAGNLDPSAENYVKQANSIGAGIIKNLVNLGSTEYDAERYIDYLPKLTDTKEQAATKLQALRKAYEDVIANLRTLYNA